MSLTEKLSLCKYLMNMLRIFCELHCSQQLFAIYSLLVANTQRTKLIWQKSDCWMFAACHIIAAYSQQKLKLFSSTRYYSPNIPNKNLVLDTVRCIFVTVTLTFMYSRSVHLMNFNSYSSQSKYLIFFTGEINLKLSPLKTLQLNGCHNCHDAKMTTCWEVFLRYVTSSHMFFCSYGVWVDTFWLFSNGAACWCQCKKDKFWLFEFNKLWLL